MSTPHPESPALKVGRSGTWQPGQPVKTPGTRLAWNCLAGWVQAWQTLQRRRVSSIRYQQESNHIAALLPAMVAEETNPDVLHTFLEILSSRSGNRPRKGEREGHPTTEMVVAANNRLARMGALPYREHRRQQSLRRTLFGAARRPGNPPRRHGAEATAPHLNPF
jgi:hypothetical protein